MSCSLDCFCESSVDISGRGILLEIASYTPIEILPPTRMVLIQLVNIFDAMLAVKMVAKDRVSLPQFPPNIPDVVEEAFKVIAL